MINDSNIDLNFDYDLINEKFGDNYASEFLNAIVSCNELFNDKYKAILLALNRIYESFMYKGLNDEKIIILIELGVIKMNNDNLCFVRENYPDQLRQFIVRNIAEYTDEVINDENFDFDELLLVLEENMADEYKVNLLDFTNNPISLKGKNYSIAVKKYILENNLDINDLQYLLESYSNELTLKKDIKEIALKHIELIMTKRYLISFNLLLELLDTETISMETKKILLVNNLKNLNEQEAKKCLRTMKMFGILSLFDGKRPRIEKDPINGEILNKFKDRGWVTSYNVDPKDPNFYRVYGRKTIANK